MEMHIIDKQVVDQAVDCELTPRADQSQGESATPPELPA
jgi:hypothetical protein